MRALSRWVASVLLVSVVLATSGCGHMQGSHSHSHSGSAGGNVALGMLAGIVLAAAVASETERRQARERDAQPVYYSAPPPMSSAPPMPRSKRDLVQEDDELPPFNPQAARSALNAVDVSSCRERGAPSGFGHAKVTMNPDGHASKVTVDEPVGLSADAARCIGDVIGKVTVAPFRGGYVTIGTSYHVP